MSVDELPGVPGSYVLVLRAAQPREITIGAFGRLFVAPGFYLYTGSAFGPGGLRARVGRHLRGGGALRWHVDFLRQASEPVEAWAATGPQRLEHTWAQALASHPACRIPLARFGASDCRCPAHLFYLQEKPEPGILGVDAVISIFGIL